MVVYLTGRLVYCLLIGATVAKWHIGSAGHMGMDSLGRGLVGSMVTSLVELDLAVGSSRTATYGVVTISGDSCLIVGHFKVD